MPKAKRRKKEQGDTASVSSDCSETNSHLTASLSKPNPSANAMPTWSQMPPRTRSLDDTALPSAEEDEVHVNVMDDVQFDDSDTFEGFLPMLESNNTNLLNDND